MHSWKAVSVSRCASKGLFEHVSGMSSVDAATGPHQQLGRLEGIDDQKTDSVSMMRARILLSRSLSSNLQVHFTALSLPSLRTTSKDVQVPARE